MKVLVVGGGGREHAICWKLNQSSKVDKLYCAPGNGGIQGIAECCNVKATDIDGMVALAKELQPDMVVVAPDDPLVLGMVDAMEEAGFRAFGPGKAAAIIEGSKSFSKELMKKYGIPTAKYEVFTSSKDAIDYVEKEGAPIVVKADGLALGKGVVVAETVEQAKDAIISIMEDKKFGESGSKVVIEECLSGPEVSVLAFTDGKTMCPMVSAQDHKRVNDNDQGPNTGGMGTFSPSRIYTKEISEQCFDTIFKPTMEAMSKEGRTFKGVLYFGLMITKDGPKVIEYNCRFGDPETQVVLPRLKSDLYDIFDAVIDERLADLAIEWEDCGCVCVVMASGGYPIEYKKGYEIKGIEEAEKAGYTVFHAGTKLENGKLVTSGGRVIGVTAKSDTLDSAIKEAYKAVEMIDFKDAHYRKDIGIKRD